LKCACSRKIPKTTVQEGIGKRSLLSSLTKNEVEISETILIKN